MNKFWWGLGAYVALQGGALAAQSCSGHSPPHSVALLELYTSEGCDSCPPADQYWSGLRASGLAPSQAVLLSLHVDYWNYIGWKDPYSSAAFTERQRWLSKLASSHTVYTPEVFVAGRELRGGTGGWSGGVPAAVKRINATPAQADIAATLGQGAAGAVQVDVKASSAKAGTLYVALTESALDSRVTAGENRGRTLHHDHVVRAWLPPVELGRDGKAAISRSVALPAGAVLKNLGVTAFVQSGQGEVLQAFSQDACL